MTRQEHIEAAVDKYTDNPANYLEYCDDSWEDKTDIDYVERAFIAGIEWADEHPNEGLVNIDKVCEYLTNHIDKGLVIYNDDTWLKRDEFIKKLKKEINK